MKEKDFPVNVDRAQLAALGKYYERVAKGEIKPPKQETCDKCPCAQPKPLKP